jgi:hypothetical protein
MSSLPISEDRQGHWAHIITDAVYNDDVVDFSDEDQALRIAKVAIAAYVKEDQDADAAARVKVNSLKRGVMEGSPEWDVLYRKYYEEEKNKRG